MCAGIARVSARTYPRMCAHLSMYLCMHLYMCIDGMSGGEVRMEKGLRWVFLGIH